MPSRTPAPSFYSNAFLVRTLSEMSFAQVFLKEIQKNQWLLGGRSREIVGERAVGLGLSERVQRAPWSRTAFKNELEVDFGIFCTRLAVSPAPEGALLTEKHKPPLPPQVSRLLQHVLSQPKAA